MIHCIAMVHWNHLKDLHNHTKHTEEMLTGINPQAVTWNSLHVWTIIITGIFTNVFQMFLAVASGLVCL